MKRIRIGKDISMRWEITTDGVAIPLDGRDLTVEIKSPAGIENNIPYRIDGNILIMTYYGYEQKRTGEYSITLWEKKGKPGQNVVDVIRAFELVRTSQEENDFVGGDLQIESVDLGTENFDILTEGGYRAINIDTLQAEALEDSVNIKGKTYSNESFTITLPKANLDSAGVMSADDKHTLQEHGNRIAQINTTLEEHTESINARITTDRISDGAVTSEKIATSAFDSTLSVSGKIAPADVVGGKLTELEKKTEGISKETIYTADDYVCIEDNNGNEVLYLDNNGFNAKNIKSNGKNVLTEHQDISLLATKEEVSSKQDKIEQVSKEERKGNNIVIESDSGQEIVRIDDNGFFVKGKEISSTGQSIASFEATKQPIGCVDIQMPIFDYNIVIGYGQSLAQGRGVFKSNFTQYNKCLYLYNKTLSTDYYTSYPPYYISNIPPAKIAANVLAYHLCGSYPNKKVIALNGGMGGYSIARLMDFARYGNNGTNIDVFHFPNYNSETLQDQTGALSRYADIIQQLRDCKEIADREGKTIGVVAFFFMQGEQDTYAGSTDTDNYSCGGDGMLWEQRFMQLRSDLFDDIKTIFEQERNPATFMGNLSDKWISNGNIWSAINKIIDENEDIYAVQPKYQLPNISDGHLDSNGYRWWGEYIGQDMVSVLINHFKPSLLRIASVERVGSKKLNVSFSAVKLPIVIDTHTSQEMKGLGFVIRDASLNSIGEVTATLENNIVMLESDVDIPEVAYLDYGLAYPKESGHLWGAGNIKDSSGIKSYYPYMEDLDWVDESGTWAVDYIPKDDNGNSYIGKPYPLNSWLYSERIKI